MEVLPPLFQLFLEPMTGISEASSLCKSSRMQELNKSRRNGETWVQKDGENDNLSLTSVSLFKGK